MGTYQMDIGTNPKELLMASPVQSLSSVRLFETPWTAACQVSLSITNSWSLPKLMSIESVIPSNNLILCCPLLLPSIFPNLQSSMEKSISVFSNEAVLGISGQRLEFQLQHQSFQWTPRPALGWTGWISLQSKGLSRISNTTVQKHQLFGAQLSL